MGFFKKKNSDSQSRRNARIWLSQTRKVVGALCVIALVGVGGVAAVQTFKKCSEWLAAETLARTAQAGFTVQNILVTGRQHISAEEILANLSIRRGDPIFGVDIAEAQKSLTALSWVKDVSITRRLPDTIMVGLQERTPAALWQYQKKISLIDKDGAVLAADDLGPWRDLPLIVGAGAETSVPALLTLLQAEPRIAGEMVAAVRINERRWDLRLKNNVTVKLPEQDVELALTRLAALHDQKNLLGRAVASIDLRQPQRVMITPLPIAAEDTATNKNPNRKI